MEYVNRVVVVACGQVFIKNESNWKLEVDENACPKNCIISIEFFFNIIITQHTSTRNCLLPIQVFWRIKKLRDDQNLLFPTTKGGDLQCQS